MLSFFLNLSHVFAYLAVLMLVALIVMICLSVLGRWVNDVFARLAQGLLDGGIGVIRGDFELVEPGIAFAIFAFLPLCHITHDHAAVDILTTRLPPRADRILRAVTEAVFAAVLVLIAVQLAVGMGSK